MDTKRNQTLEEIEENKIVSEHYQNRIKLIKELLKKANEIPPYYIMYPGRDKSVALKDSVLKPQFPKDSR